MRFVGKLVVVSAVAALASSCSSAPANQTARASELCDLTALDTSKGSSREPLMLPCRCEVAAELAAIESADPAHDAQQAIARGDMRFVGIMEYSVLTPGVEDWSVVDRHGVRIVEGTSDVVRCYEQARLTEIAEQYAAAYNRTILAAAGDRVPASAE